MIFNELYFSILKLTFLSEQVIWKYVEKVNISDQEAEDFSKSFKQNQNAYKSIGETIKRQNKVSFLEEKRTMLLGVFIGRHTLDAENIYNELIDGKLDSDMLD